MQIWIWCVRAVQKNIIKMAEKGTDGDWFIVREAECSDLEESCEELDASTESEISDFIDNSDVAQGDSLQVFQQQEREQHERSLQLLKRKHLQSPKQSLDSELSPRLSAISISPVKKSAKRRLFQQQNDSGVDLETQNEAENFNEDRLCQVEQNCSTSDLDCPPSGREEGVVNGLAEDILRSSNRKATQLCKFKTMVNVSFTELTRCFKNDKTCASHWVVAVFDVLEPLFEASKHLLKDCCTYYNVGRWQNDNSNVCVMLLSFKASKSRETTVKLMKNLFKVEDHQIMADPPRLRSTLAALYWFKTAFSSVVSTYGETPEWIRRQTLLGHQSAEELTFNFGEMVQWAYDNEYTDEASVAYEYARLAEENSNAAAWLNSNNQAKYVKDCVQMVRHYRTAEMRQMSMSAWIYRRSQKFGDKGDWKPICQFLKYQGVEIPVFINTLKFLLKGTPKKNCLVICGPPNTGKSMFGLSLLRFMGGRVLSFANYKSQFWLQPLNSTKMALIDDATSHCWDYIDTYLRNALDGNEICVDMKHRTPIQIKCPPLIITSNIDVHDNDRWRYLRSRVSLFYFKNEMQFDENGNPNYILSEINWKFFFKRLQTQLELSDCEEEGDGESERPFKCTARRPTDSI